MQYLELCGCEAINSVNKTVEMIERTLIQQPSGSSFFIPSPTARKDNERKQILSRQPEAV
jgi:hypothetical protein